MVCAIGESCMNGYCFTTTSYCNPTQPCGDGLVCQSNFCLPDPCINKCPSDHVCINNGECRLSQGIYCTSESSACIPPYECIDGVCVKDGLNLKYFI